MRTVLAGDIVRGIVERVYGPPSRGQRTTYSRQPNGGPQHAEDPQPPSKLFKHGGWATKAPAKLARAESKRDGETVTDAWSGRHSAPLGPKGHHITTSPVPWGQHRYLRDRSSDTVRHNLVGKKRRANAAIRPFPTPGDPTDTRS